MVKISKNFYTSKSQNIPSRFEPNSVVLCEDTGQITAYDQDGVGHPQARLSDLSPKWINAEDLPAIVDETYHDYVIEFKSFGDATATLENPAQVPNGTRFRFITTSLGAGQYFIKTRAEGLSFLGTTNNAGLYIVADPAKQEIIINSLVNGVVIEVTKVEEGDKWYAVGTSPLASKIVFNTPE